MRWMIVLALCGCTAYESPCTLGPDEAVLTPMGVATSLRRSATGIVVTSIANTSSANPQRTVTIAELDPSGAPGASTSFAAGSIAIDEPTDVEPTADGLAIARVLETASPDGTSVARSLELEIVGPNPLPPRTLPFADCTNCRARTPALRFLGGHLVLLYADESTTDTVFAIIDPDGTIVTSGPLVGLTPGALGRFKGDVHADALVLETPQSLEIVDDSLTILATLPAPFGAALDFDLASGVAQLAWIEGSSLLTSQLGFDGTVLEPAARISQAASITAVAATDALTIFGFDDDRHYVAAATAGQKRGGDLETVPGDDELAIPAAGGFAYFTSVGTSVSRRVIGCAP